MKNYLKLWLMACVLMCTSLSGFAADVTKTVFIKNDTGASNIALWIWNGGTNHSGGTWPGCLILKDGNVLATAVKASDTSAQVTNVKCEKVTDNGVDYIKVDVTAAEGKEPAGLIISKVTTYGSNCQSSKMPDKDLEFTHGKIYDSSGETSSYYPGYAPVEPTSKVPESLYMIGTCGYGYDDSGKPAKMHKDGNVFTLSDVTVTSDLFFRFQTTETGGTKYGSNGNNPSPDDNTGVIKGNDKNWKLPKGKTYTITVTFTETESDGTITYTASPISSSGDTSVPPVLYTSGNAKMCDFTKSGSDWKGQFTISGGTNFYFKVDNTTYTSSDNNTTVTLGSPMGATTSGKNWWLAAADTYDITIAGDYSTITVTKHEGGSGGETTTHANYRLHGKCVYGDEEWNSCDFVYNSDTKLWVIDSVQLKKGDFGLQIFTEDWQRDNNGWIAGANVTEAGNVTLGAGGSWGLKGTFKLTFNSTGNVLTVEVIELDEEEAVAPVLYTSGNAKMCDFTKSGSDWKGQFTINGGTNFYFKVDNTTYKSSDSNTTVILGSPMGTTTAGNNWWLPTADTYDITIAGDYSSITVVKHDNGNSGDNGDDNNDKVPAALYMIGTCGYGYDDWGTPAEMNKSGNVFTLTTATLPAGNNDKDLFFRFQTEQSGGTAYGSGGENANPDSSKALKKDDANNWVLAKGQAYTIKVTFDNDGNATLSYSTGGGQPVSGMMASGTLPVLYINVYDDADHTSLNGDMINKDYILKEEHKYADYYIQVPEGCNVEWAQEYGSVDEPLPMTIKLRGNYTRSGFSKKPYKIKLTEKQNLFGMNKKGAKSKHWALLAHADDNFGYMRNFVGFTLGENIGLPWTPRQRPVEVVINGDYRGIYFLTESIRIEKGRIEIEELADEETQTSLLSGGYLVELDNYSEGQGDDFSKQYRTTEQSCSGQPCDLLRVTYDTPEVLSDVQRRFIKDQFDAMNTRVGRANSSDDLWQYMDLDDAVRYYMVMEIISHYEAYHGSTYLFRDRGNDQKWHFSPLWDCGNAFNGRTDAFFYDCDPYGNTWIPSMRTNSTFNAKLKESWKWFMSTGYAQIRDAIDAYAAEIAEAAKKDADRWENAPLTSNTYDPVNNNAVNPSHVVSNRDIAGKAQQVKDHLAAKVKWLATSAGWGAYTEGADVAEPARDTTAAAALPDYVDPDYVEPEPIKVYIYAGDNNQTNGSNVEMKGYLYDPAPATDSNWPGKKAVYDESLSITVGDKTYTGIWVLDVPGANAQSCLVVNGGSWQWPLNGTNIALPGTDVFFNTADTASQFQQEFTIVVVEENPWSGTLPVMSITTDSPDDLAAKVKTTGTWTLSYADGSVATPNKNNKLEIKGRGSETWTNFDKKPYKIEFDKKQTLCGHIESKHFVLLPYLTGSNDANSNVMLNNIAGYQLSRLAGMEWTPAETPIELVIDGEYLGLYFMTENIRPSVNRVPMGDYADNGDLSVDIVYNPQEDWLLQIDNTLADDDADIVANLLGHKVVSENPEFDAAKLTKRGLDIDEMHGYLDAKIAEIENFLGSIHSTGSIPEDVFDLDEAARFFIVQELMDDSNAYNTSLYLHHTTDGLWKLGPVWDFSRSFATQGAPTCIRHGHNINDPSSVNHGTDLPKSAIVSTLYGNVWFRMRVINEFQRMMGKSAIELESAISTLAESNGGIMPELYSHIIDQADILDQAREADAARWPQYYQADDSFADKADDVISNLRSNASFLETQWNGSTTGVVNISVDRDDINAATEYFDVTGRRLSAPATGSIVIVRRGSQVSKILY